MTKRELNDILADENQPSDIKEYAQEQLDRLNKLESSETDGVDADIRFAVNEFKKSVESLGNQGVDKKKVREIINEELADAKFGIDNLQPSVLDLISKTQTVQIVNWQNVKIKTSDGKKRRIFEIILSDFEAGNNVYLFGGAGTGKTYIAGQIAKSLNYKLITLNCNQFTSPLDVIGGQTIEGYQEGRLTTAFGNLFDDINKQTGKKYSGAVLLLDELPKLDPNTAGVLNDGLSKIKDPVELSESGVVIPPTIQNGRGEIIDKKNIFVIATGNSLLNEADKDYEANFKQDLSLQDRFVGSTYELIIDPQYELDNIMSNIMVNKQVTNFTFIFNFLFKLRMAIEKNEFQSRAFVSQRIMVSFRDTYIAFRLNAEMGEKKIPNPKTLKIAVESFLNLFTSTQVDAIKQDVDVEEFYQLIETKNQEELSKLNSEQDILEAKILIEAFEINNINKIK